MRVTESENGLKKKRKEREKKKMTRNRRPFPKESALRTQRGTQTLSFRYIFLVRDSLGGGPVLDYHAFKRLYWMLL